MKLLQITIFLTIIGFGLTQNLQQQHKFSPLENLDPLQTIQLMSGDWTAILPESVRGIAKALLGKEQQSSPLDMLSKAQGLLGGQNTASSLGGLLGGLTGGNATSGSSSLSNILGGFSGLLGNDSGSESSGSGILSGLTDKVNGMGSLGALSGFMSHNKKQSQ